VLRDTQLISKVDDNNHYFELELAPNADAQVLLRRLIDAGASIQRFEMMQPSLHQIFLQRVGANGIEAGMSGHG
jgi:ABC-2 type transport system ATP-binding protein